MEPAVVPAPQPAVERPFGQLADQEQPQADRRGRDEVGALGKEHASEIQQREEPEDRADPAGSAHEQRQAQDPDDDRPRKSREEDQAATADIEGQRRDADRDAEGEQAGDQASARRA